jgi:hypothetical protein
MTIRRCPLCGEHEWVSVKDALPESEVRVLVYEAFDTCSGWMMVAEHWDFKDEDYKRWWDGEFAHETDKVTHWKPLTPPEE